MTSGQGGSAVARSAALTVLPLSLAAGGHVLGGGQPPDVPLLLAAAAIGMIASRPLARTPLRARTVLPWSLAVQVVAHLALSWLASAESTDLAVTGHHGVELAAAAPHHGATLTVTMASAHLFTTLVTVLLLVGADRAAGRAADRWRGLLLVVDAPVRPVTRGPALPAEAGPRVPRGHPGTDHPRRGPPFVLAA